MTETSDRNVGTPHETAVAWAGTETMEVRKTAPIEVAASDRDLAKSTPTPAKTREVSMAESKDRPALRPDDPRHGTWSGYNRGCREECCRKAARQYQKIRLHDANHGKARKVDATGSHRRLQALGALGWDFYSIAAEAGRDREWAWQVWRRKTLYVETAQKVDEVYERLCMTRPEGWIADRARKRAAERGWAPPLAWEDIDNDPEPYLDADPGNNLIDEVKVQRVLDGIKQDCTLAERLQVIDQWTGSLHQLERITGWNVHRLIGKRAA